VGPELQEHLWQGAALGRPWAHCWTSRGTRVGWKLLARSGGWCSQRDQLWGLRCEGRHLGDPGAHCGTSRGMRDWTGCWHQ
jgi:hypothetical protein